MHFIIVQVFCLVLRHLAQGVTFCVCTSLRSSCHVLCMYVTLLKLLFFVYVRHLSRVLRLFTCILDVPNFKSAGTPTTLTEGFLALLSPFLGSDDSSYID